MKKNNVSERISPTLEKDANYGKVIFVGHGMAFGTLTYIEQMKPAEIIECSYQLGQDYCVYSFR